MNEKDNSESSPLKKSRIKKNETYKLLGSIDEAPEFMRDNNFILNGYRLKCNTIWKCIKSLLFVHNESVNIWSHLLGAFLMIIMLFNLSFVVKLLYNNFNVKFPFQVFENDIKMSTDKFAELTYKNILESLNDFHIKTNEMIKGNAKKFNEYKTNFEIYFEKIVKNESNKFKEKTSTLLSIFLNKLESNIYANKLDNINQNEEGSLEKWPLVIFLLSGIICLSFSFSYHMTNSISAKVNNIVNRFDYCGISILIVGSCFPPYFYYFYFNLFARYFYLGFISVFGLIVFFLSLKEEFYLSSWRFIRGVVFIAMGLSAGFPIIHISITGINGIGSPRYLFWYIGGFSYIFGTIIYINRVPEKFFPGKFDYFGASHQIFHIFVLIGAFTQFIGSLDAFYFRSENMTNINVS